MTLGLLRSITARPALSPIGLDVGPRCLRAAQLGRVDGQWRILRLAQWNRREAETGTGISPGFARRIQQALDQDGFRGRRLVVGLSIPDVELHTLEIPDRGDLSDAGKFADAARWELQRVSGIAPEQAASGYWRVPAGDGTRTTARGAVARREDVVALCELARSTRLDCERVDATSCALSRLGSLLRRRSGADPQEVWSVLDVGSRMLRLVVAVGEVPVLVRNLGVGSQDWTRNVAESLQLSPEAAEIHKCDYGIATGSLRVGARGMNPAAREDPSSQIAAMIFNILRGDLDLIVAEIERSYEYIMRCYPERPAGAVLLVGAGADLKGLDRYLAEQLGVDVTPLEQAVQQPDGSLIVDQIAGARILSRTHQSLNAFGCAIGLAINTETRP
ncbi:MAG: cell division FtsA domain-containing protein [Phycisphaerae bacterium]